MESNHISAHVDRCAKGFIQLADALTKNPDRATQISPESVNDEFDRFKIWAGNIAAHRKGRRSLEYRLRDALHLKQEIQNTLTDLYESVAEALAIVLGERIPWDELSDSESDVDSDSEQSTNSDDGGIEDDTELKQLSASIISTITCLFRLSIVVRDPAPDTQHQSIITIDKTYFESYDISHVRSKFQREDYLVDRLGRATSSRRQYLTYREVHHQKLTKNVEKIGLEDSKTEYTTNSTEATAKPEKSAAYPLVDDEDTLSQTSYAMSVNTQIRTPALPREARDQEYFECPYCYMIVSIHTGREWKQHVYRDLHPYCCTFEQCATADRLYDSRRAWWKHELEAHRTSWHCVQGCEKTFTNEDVFLSHVHTHHPELTNENMLRALKQTAVKSASPTDQAHCPLCNEKLTLRSLQKHLGHHQEELALFVLPPNIDEAEDDSPDDNSIAQSEESAIFREEDEDDQANQPYDLERNSQRCYNCQRSVERKDEKDDKNHTTCHCTAQFCFVCAAPWKTCNCPWFNYSHFKLDVPLNIPQDDIIDEAEENSPGEVSVDEKHEDAILAMSQGEREDQAHDSKGLEEFNTGSESLLPEKQENELLKQVEGLELSGMETLLVQQEEDSNQLDAAAPTPGETAAEALKKIKESDEGKLAKLEKLLLALRDQRLKRDLAEMKRNGDENKLRELEKRILAQNDERLEWEETEMKRKRDSDKLARLEQLILAQKNEQFKREAAQEAQRSMENVEAESEAAKGQAAKVAAAENAAHEMVDSNAANSYNKNEAEEKWRAQEERNRVVEDERRKAGEDKQRDVVFIEEHKHIIEEYERKIEGARLQREEILMQVRIREETQKERKKEEWERSLQKQKQNEEEEAEKKQNREEELEDSMRNRLASFGFEETQIHDMLKPEMHAKSLLQDDKKPLNPLRLTHQPTYIKASKEHLDVETLLYYDIPYEIDNTDPNYIIVLREMESKEIEILFEHTRRLRNRGSSKLLVENPQSGTKPDYAWVRRRKRASSQGQRSSSPGRSGVKEMFY